LKTIRHRDHRVKLSSALRNSRKNGEISGRAIFLLLISIVLSAMLFSCAGSDETGSSEDPIHEEDHHDDDDDFGFDESDHIGDVHRDDPEVPRVDYPSRGELFRETGPFPVGNTTVVLVDENRFDPLTETGRTLVTEIWYPATDESVDLPRNVIVDFFAPWQDEALLVMEDIGVLEEEIANFLVGTDSARDAPIRGGSTSYPLVIFSHGNGGLRFQNFTQCEFLASQGFIVVSPDHTGNSALAPLPDGIVQFDPEIPIHALLTRLGDVPFLIDQFTAPVPSPELAEIVARVDGDRIAAGGHSFGGLTTLNVTKTDQRIKAVFALAFPAFPWFYRNYRAHTMYAFGLEDQTLQDILLAFEAGYLLTPPPKFSLGFFNAGHFSFSDICVMMPSLIHEDGCGTGRRVETGQPFTFIEHRQFFEVLNTYVLAFLNNALYQDEDARDELSYNRYPAVMEYAFDM
jgi:pimeloyl-ACP methyl ester carboxylesterase